MTNGSQTVTDSREYDSFGLTVASSGMNTPFGFVGGQGYRGDPDSGLLLLGARYYDASVGRFISRDPIGYEGGDVNLYRYCGNDPVNASDPSGHVAILVAVLVVAAIVMVAAANESGRAHLLQHRPPPNEPEVPQGPITAGQLEANRHTAHSLRQLDEYNKNKTFKDLVDTGREWDYKRFNFQKYEDFGNWHFGVVAHDAGFGEVWAMSWAGVAQQRGAASEVGVGWPFLIWPYGDEPRDNHWIRKGYKWAHEHPLP